MPKHKDLKRAVRTRMQKTGESYTAARAQLTRQPKIDPARFAELAGMSDDAVQAKTGKSWEEWVAVLDAVDAAALEHPAIVKHLHEVHGTDSWWSQMVTVGYERIRGLRQKGQLRDGTFEVNKSKTYPVPVDELYAAFVDEDLRARWIGQLELEVRACRPDQSVRWVWDDGCRVHAYFTDKGPKSVVAVQHSGLPSSEDAEAVKVAWAERLARLAEVVS